MDARTASIRAKSSLHPTYFPGGQSPDSPSLNQEMIVLPPLYEVLRPYVTNDSVMTARSLVLLSWLVANHEVDSKRTVRAMAEEFGIPKPSVTRTMDKLVADSFVRRRVDEMDRRSVFCTATVVGKRFLGAPAGTVKRRTGRATGGKKPGASSGATRGAET